MLSQTSEIYPYISCFIPAKIKVLANYCTFLMTIILDLMTLVAQGLEIE